MSKIIETKVATHERDLLIISGDVYVKVGGMNMNNNTVQTGQNDDPGLVGLEYLGFNGGWHRYEQKIMIGPEWYSLDKNETVPVVSPTMITSKKISDQEGGDTENLTGFAVETFRVEWEKNRITLYVQLGLCHPNDYSDGYQDWAYLLRLSYCVAALGFKSQPSRHYYNFRMKTTASHYENDPGDYHPPKDATDGDLSTRWAADTMLAPSTWIHGDLGQVRHIAYMNISWYKGDQGRTYTYRIEGSLDGTPGSFFWMWNDTSSGNEITELLDFTLTPTQARYIRITVEGNNENTWASINEFHVLGL